MGGMGIRGGFWYCFGGNLAFPPKTIPAKAGISQCRAYKQRRIRRQFPVPKQLIPAKAGISQKTAATPPKIRLWRHKTISPPSLQGILLP